MLRIVVLGAAAGGGVPQWNCGCQVCRAARGEHPELQSTQASIAFSADGTHWFLVNASPDLRQQLIHTPQLHPKPGALRHSPIAGVILTNGEIDAVAGLLSMPDGSPSGIEVIAFTVPGKGAWYLEGKAHPGGTDGAGDTLGLRIRDKATNRHFYFIAACAHVSDELKSRLAGAPLLFFDGTVWRDDEMVVAGLGTKTGQSMGH